jgi:hypothetical protein
LLIVGSFVHSDEDERVLADSWKRSSGSLVEDSKENFNQQKEAAQEKVREFSDQAKERGRDHFEAAKEQVGERVSAAQEKVSGFSDQAKERGRDHVEAAKEQVGERVSAAQEKFGEHVSPGQLEKLTAEQNNYERRMAKMNRIEELLAKDPGKNGDLMRELGNSRAALKQRFQEAMQKLMIKE